MDEMEKRVALISVFDKRGIVGFALQLVELDWKILASGGTAIALEAAGVPVKNVASLVGGEAILSHRVVTLSREVHAGLLARNTEKDIAELKRLGIPRIDLVCVDPYPLKDAINKPGSTPKSVIEMTDIGGPAMLRSAAKGGRIVIAHPGDQQMVIDWLKDGEPDKDEFLTRLAAKAERVAAGYALTSAVYHGKGSIQGIIGEKAVACRYGENPYQAPAALFTTNSGNPLGLDKFILATGASPSYNNYCDIERLLQTMTHIAAAWDVNCSSVPCIALAVKHGNACGAAVGNNPEEVIRKMVAGDPRAIFGGLVMLNFELTEALAEILLTHLMKKGRRLLDGVIAPAITDAAIEMLKRKKDKCRVLVNPVLASLNRSSLDTTPRFRYVRGGFLFQPNYVFVLNLNDSEIKIHDPASSREPDQEIADILLAWAIGSTSNSNTVTLVKNGQLISNGCGRQDRISACELAVKLAQDAGHNPTWAVACSDSFFPFIDGPEILIKAGIKTIFASSGSINDKRLIALCKEKGVVLYLIPDAVGRGFYAH